MHRRAGLFSYAGVGCHDAGTLGNRARGTDATSVSGLQILPISGVAGTAHPMVEEMGDHPFQLLPKPLEPVLLIHEVRRKLARRTAVA